jgi:hypothetical protein
MKTYKVDVKWTGTIAVIGPLLATDDREAMKIAQEKFEENSNGFIHLVPIELTTEKEQDDE